MYHSKVSPKKACKKTPLRAQPYFSRPPLKVNGTIEIVVPLPALVEAQ